MLPKKGRMLHPWNGLAKSAKDYAELIADALRREHDETHRTVKTVMRWTGASERTAKHWLAGTHSPCAWHLILLARESDATMATLLMLAGRELNVSALSLISLRAGLMYAVNAIDEAIDSSP